MNNNQAVIEGYTYKEYGKSHRDLKIELKCAQIEINCKEGKVSQMKIYGKEKGNKGIPFYLGNTLTLTDSCDHKKWLISQTINRENSTKVSSDLKPGEYNKSSMIKAPSTTVFRAGNQDVHVSFGQSGEVNGIFVFSGDKNPELLMTINGEGKVTTIRGDITKTEIYMSPKVLAAYPNWRTKIQRQGN